MFLQGPYFSEEGALGLPKAKSWWEHCQRNEPKSVMQRAILLWNSKATGCVIVVVALAPWQNQLYMQQTFWYISL